MQRFRKQFVFTMLLASTIGAVTQLGAEQQLEAGPKTGQDPSLPKIEYLVEEQDRDSFSALRATENGKSYTLISSSKKMCLSIQDQRDFDGNGLIDALVTHIQGCGGNCCGDSFFFVSAFGDGRFRISEVFGYSWVGPDIEKWKGRWSVVVSSQSEGSMNTDLQEVTERFILDAGKAVAVERRVRKELQSIVEMRSTIFQTQDDDERHVIEYDLDGDGKKDQIIGELWVRWGRISWSVQFANGKKFSSNSGCKRIGVLATKTNGFNDLVCDQDAVLRWNGVSYN